VLGLVAPLTVQTLEGPHLMAVGAEGGGDLQGQGRARSRLPEGEPYIEVRTSKETLWSGKVFEQRVLEARIRQSVCSLKVVEKISAGLCGDGCGDQGASSS